MSNLIEICVQLSLILFYKNYFFHLIHTNFTHTPFAEICRISKTTFYNSIFFFNFIIKTAQISLTHILPNLANSTPPTISSLLLFLSSHPHKFHLLLFYRILLKFLSCIPLSNLLNFIFSSNLN